MARGTCGIVHFARSLVELITKRNLPAHVDLLRPPTFAQLREHLHQHPGRYHILHFDGHGTLSGSSEGRIVFETADGKDDPITAGQLNDLLGEYAVPGVVLNACQSAMVNAESEDAFSSVAAALLRSGARSVVAMSYSLYVSGAQEFLPAFYRSLFETGSMAEAARAGRLQMRAQRKRVCSRGPLRSGRLAAAGSLSAGSARSVFCGEGQCSKGRTAPSRGVL